MPMAQNGPAVRSATGMPSRKLFGYDVGRDLTGLVTNLIGMMLLHR
ncbi:hypothetical protein GGD65_002481 [Bradyrhizobium sp. CIR18]|nr:hypothetical protein [Bradyrhizobium sp. CIR18]